MRRGGFPLRLVVWPVLVALAGCAPAAPTAADAPTPDAVATVTEDVRADPDYVPKVPGYDRSCSPGRGCSFGPAWSDDVDQEFGHNGCDTRNDILRRDLTEAEVDPNTRGCVVLSGTLHDPYTGQVVAFRKGANGVQIDHLFPLAAAWDRGAWEWSAEDRRNFANDPANLQATTTAINTSKSDKLPGDWMPPVGRCDYARRVAEVADKWHLVLTSRDVAALRGCAD